MTKSIPQIQKYMSTSPHSIGEDQSLRSAHEVLSKHSIRHLPVLKGGKMVGMVTQRDLAVVESMKDVDPEKVMVSDVMSTDVYTVSPEAMLSEVTAEMAAKKYGSAVVIDNHKVVGIFTTVDVCRALTELLESRLK
jgi:acetoin utilization protein AcuB